MKEYDDLVACILALHQADERFHYANSGCQAAQALLDDAYAQRLKAIHALNIATNDHRNAVLALVPK